MGSTFGSRIRVLVLAVALAPALASAHDEPVRCQGLDATLHGTIGADVLVGTSGPDVIHGLAGDDIIEGKKGNDVICGGDGHDILMGNGGDDVVVGNKGHDVVIGNSGNDLLKGNKGDDSIDGGAGLNVCKGGPGSDSTSNCLEPTPALPAPTPVPTPSEPGAQVPADFAGVTWLHTNVSGWAVTSPLSVSFGSGLIHLDYDKADVWPGNAEGLNGNPWIFVWQNNQWYAATWEWLRVGQTAKSMSSVAGDHIKRAPLESFQPVSGQLYGFMVSGLARDAQRNVLERTPVVMVPWP
ncbi:MAG: calcium-binding protein [Candidatus Binatia bacterium]